MLVMDAIVVQGAISGAAVAYLSQSHRIRGDTFIYLHGLYILLSYAVYSFYSSPSALLATLRLSLFHIVASASINGLYNVSPWHPLNRFPGPFWNKVSSIPLMLLVASGKRHLGIVGLHKRYGKIVRTGPNTLSFNSQAAVGDIYKAAKAWDKSDAYNLGRLPGRGLFFMCEREEHGARRRHWADAFSNEALRHYDTILHTRTQELKSCLTLRRDSGDVVCLNDVLQHWSYDVMGSIVFGSSSGLELMKNGDEEGFIANGQLATAAYEILGEMPPLLDVMTSIPVLSNLQALHRLAASFVDKTDKQFVKEGLNIFSHLERKDEDGIAALRKEDLTLDTMFAIQAGSDTTSGVQTLVFYHLLSNMTCYRKLQAELDTAFPDSSHDLNLEGLANLPFLNAVINEALRLGAPFPGLSRVCPKAGAFIDNEYIPGGTVVGVPAWAQNTAEENFYPSPELFIPERWLEDQIGLEKVRSNKSAIMTFSFGPFGCLGKNLALSELRLVTAAVVRAFDLSLAPGFDHAAFNYGVRNLKSTFFDYPLRVVATVRSPQL